MEEITTSIYYPPCSENFLSAAKHIEARRHRNDHLGLGEAEEQLRNAVKLCKTNKDSLADRTHYEDLADRAAQLGVSAKAIVEFNL